MTFDIFLSICQTEVEGYLPSERVMFENFFDQVVCADELGFGTAWIAETHLSCQVQKENPGAVIPHFKGEIGLNTDILQLAHLVFAQTKKIQVGSAIRNIICNGGPLAHAEALKTFLTLHGLRQNETRCLEWGFAAGRFPFSSVPYGFSPQSPLEKVAWDVIKNKYFQQATEIFLRTLKGEMIASTDVSRQVLTRADFRSEDHWSSAQKASGIIDDRIELDCHWKFPKVGVIPFDAPLDLVKLTLGSHDPATQILANQFLPVGVFNLSITPQTVIEETHERMRKHYHAKGGAWKRSLMPRTVMIFLNEDRKKALQQAEMAWKNYWLAMEGTLDPKKVEQAVENTIAGEPVDVAEKIKLKYHPEDRLMLWFDFNIHDSEAIKKAMRLFIEKVAPRLG